MSKKILPLILCSLLLLFFNLLFFLWIDAEQRAAADWINYGFVTFSCLVMFWSVTNRRVENGDTFAMTLPWNGIFYFLVSFVAAVVATVYLCSMRLTLTIQSLITLIFLISLAIHTSANRRTATRIYEREERLEERKVCIARLKDICQRSVDTPVHKDVKRLLDMLLCAPLGSFAHMSCRIDDLDSELSIGNYETASTIATAIMRTLSL